MTPPSRTFRIPDFISRCPYPLAYHPNGDNIARSSDQWYKDGCTNLTKEKLRHLSVLQAGVLSAFVYNDATDDHLRASCDIMNLIFHYGDLSDGLMKRGNEMIADIVMNAFWFPHDYRPTHSPEKLQPTAEPDASKLARDLSLRLERDAAPGFKARFLENLGLFFEGRHVQSKHRDSGIVPTLQMYIDIRRDSSALKPLIDFLEYTLQIDAPDHVMEHPTMQLLKQCVNDYCTWSNDIFSFNKEQACGDTYNMVVILMNTQGLGLQAAIDRVGDMCLQSLDAFNEAKKSLPTWSPEIDRDVARFVGGLESWLISCLHWSFMSGRYFGTEGMKIKETLCVDLLPPRRRPQEQVQRDIFPAMRS